LTGACAQPPLPVVTPAQIPALLTEAREHPQNAGVRFRLAAALAAADRCDTAVVVAEAGRVMAPKNALAPLIIGSCQERAGRYDLAVATYDDFTALYPTAAGAPTVRAKSQLALRAGAEATARAALASETELAHQAPEAGTLAVLPLVIAGDSSVQPLSRGLAELITTDLAVIRTLRLLERLQIGTLLDELQLGEGQRADPATAARVGRLLRAERMVQGVATIPPRGTVQLSASVVTPAGVVRSLSPVTGAFTALLDLEKQLVFDLAAQLGVQLTPAERERVLRQGPRNLAAFLAYSAGLEAMDRGDYSAAARHFNAAVRADPSFQGAQQGQEAAQAAPGAQQAGATPGGLVTVVEAMQQVTTPPSIAAGGALGSAGRDLAPSLGDAVTQASGGSATGVGATERQVTTESRGISSIASATAIIHIIFQRPP